MASRPASTKSQGGASRPATSSKSRPATSSKSRPVSSLSARPTTGLSVRSRPVTSRPATSGGELVRPSTGGSICLITNEPIGSSRPATTMSRSSDQVWSEKETGGGITDRSEVSTGSGNPLIITQEEPEKGCWHCFSKCVCGMWATREINQDEDKEIFVRTTIRELVVYSLFIIVLCIVTFGMTSSTTYYYTLTMKNLFPTMSEIKNVDELWDFMEGEMLDGIFWDYWYNDGDYRNYICPGGEESAGPCPVAASDRNILYENRLLGLPRLRQLRVVNGSCKIHEHFQSTIKNCYAAYSESDEDKDDFHPNFRQHTSETAWKFQTAEEMETSEFSISGKTGSYSGNGAVQNLHSVKNESQAIINELKENLWIGRNTRFVSVDFTVYNANINLFCVINLIFEFPPSGGVIPSATFRTVKLIRYVNTFDHVIFACEFIYILFIIYYIIEETLEIYKMRLAYFKGFWNNVDLIVVGLSITNQCLNFYTLFVVQTQLEVLLSEPDKYADFVNLGWYADTFKAFVAICVFFSWIKFFKYISFNKTMTQLSSTLSRCAADIAGFTIMFVIVFVAFAQLGYLLFGTQVDDYESFDTSIFTLLRTILGDFNFNDLEQSNRVLGPIFFLFYVFFVFFVLLNMFLAIINDTYSVVKEEIAMQKNDFEISEYMKRGYNNMLGKVGMRNKLMDVENALRLAGADGEVTFDEVRQNLKKCNFSALEIEMFFAKYDVDGDGLFSFEEAQQLSKDLDADLLDRDVNRPNSGRPGTGGGTDSPVQEKGIINHEEFGILANRVDRMEGIIGNIVSKIDMVLIKLESMEKSKSKRKANMSKILDGFTDPDMDEEDLKNVAANAD